MSQDDLDFLYDEDEAVAHIRKCISLDLKEKVSNDDIIYVVDLLYDYYEDSGLIESGSEEVDIDEDDVVGFIVEMMAKDKEAPKLTRDEIVEMVRGEFDYSESIGLFD